MTRDIAQAVAIETEYRSNKAGRSLLALLEPAGYTSLDDFERDKKIYSIKQHPFMIVQFPYVDNVEKAMPYMFSVSDNNYLVIKGDERPFIIHATDNADVESWEAINIPVIRTWLTGHTMLINTNDFAIIVSLDNTKIRYTCDDLIKFILAKLKENYFSVEDILTEEDNWLVANGNQVFGTFFYESVDERRNWIIQLNTDNAEGIREQIVPLPESYEYYELSCNNTDLINIIKDWGNN